MTFYAYGSVHHWSVLIIVQQDATQSSLFIILHVHPTCFGCQPHPSSGVHKTVTTSSVTDHIFRAATSLAKLAWPRWREAAVQKMWSVPEDVVTVLCSPDDGCGWRSRHVEWTCRIINRLFCVASRWTIINIFCMKVFIVHYHGQNVKIFFSNNIHIKFHYGVVYI